MWKVIEFNRNNFYDYFYTKTDKELAKFCGVRGATEIIPGTIGLRRKLECNTAFIISKYEHGMVQYGLKGEVHNCSFDTTQYAGLLMWNGKAEHLGKTNEERETGARYFLDDYTDYCNGEIDEYEFYGTYNVERD